ncbi:MAG: lysophospholipid acyltransferase family protein [Bacteroidota bacterium]
MIAALVYYLFVLPLSWAPMFILYRFSDIFYLLLLTVVPYRKKVIEENLKRSFPQLSSKERKQIKRRFYRHFADILIEGIANLSLSERALRKRLTVKNPEVMEELYRKGESVILVSGHYNNWEWLISAQNFLFSHQAMGIGMPMTSKFWDRKVNQRRERFGMKVVHSGNFKKEIDEHMNRPLAVLTLADQSPGNSKKSYWMDFLHQKTAVLFGAEMMAHTYDMSVVFFCIRKVRRGHYAMELKLITENPKEMSWGQITEAHTRFLEKEILRQPEYWIWSHKRWKRELPADLEQLKKEQHEKFNAHFCYEPAAGPDL